MRKTIRLSIAFFIAILIITSLENIYWHNHYEPIVQSKETRINDLNRQVANSQVEIHNLQEQNSQLANLTGVWLVSKLGWFVHRSVDVPFYGRPNTFTIYGSVANVGLLNCSDASLTVYLYGDVDGSLTGRQPLAKYSYHVGFVGSLEVVEIGNQNFDCSVADQVKNVTIALEY